MDVFIWGYGDLRKELKSFCRAHRAEMGADERAREIAANTGWVSSAPGAFAHWLQFPYWDENLHAAFDHWFHEQDAIEGCILGSQL